MFKYRSLENERFSKYDYNGQTIRLDYGSSSNGIMLILNGNKIGPLMFEQQNLSGNIDNTQQYAQCELPDGKKCIISTGHNINDRPYSVFVDGFELSLIARDKTPKRSIENLRSMAKYPIAEISRKDFYALKNFNEDAVVFWAQSQKKEPKYYLKISDKPFNTTEFTSLSLPDKNDFIEISPSDIQLGDDILVVNPSIFGNHMQLIENVSYFQHDTYTPYAPSDYSYGLNLNQRISATIEGSNIIWTTDDIKYYTNNYLTQMLKDYNLKPDNITNIFTPDITYDEFLCIQTLQEHDINITEQILQNLVDGKSPDEIVAEIDQQTMQIADQIMRDLSNGKQLNETIVEANDQSIKIANQVLQKISAKLKEHDITMTNDEIMRNLTNGKTIDDIIDEFSQQHIIVK